VQSTIGSKAAVQSQAPVSPSLAQSQPLAMGMFAPPAATTLQRAFLTAAQCAERNDHAPVAVMKAQAPGQNPARVQIGQITR